MEVFLLRHGRTAGNGEKRYIGGRTDEPLCDEGIRTAEASGKFPYVKTVYISPMVRARQTAEILFPKAELRVLDGLREMDFGVFEGRSPDEMVNDPVYRGWVDNMCEGLCPGGEDLDDFKDRVAAAFQTALEESQAECAERLVILAHGGTIMSVMNRFAYPDMGYYAWYAENCRGWRAFLDMTNGKPLLVGYEYLDELKL